MTLSELTWNADEIEEVLRYYFEDQIVEAIQNDLYALKRAEDCEAMDLEMEEEA